MTETPKVNEKTLIPGRMHYCPGCGHTIVHRLIAELMDEMGLREKAILSAPVGCSVLLYNYLNCDIIECAHGRVPEVMTAIKRLQPDKFVLAYQGDGDLAAIGTNETIHTANRGENITVVFINNAIYGMTGGQLAPTTLPGQWSSTTPNGRGVKEGEPLKICEMLATMEGPTYIERIAMNSADSIKRTKEVLRNAFECQMEGKGYSFVEVLSMCPTGWKMDMKESVQFIDKMKSYFPEGVFVDRRKDR